MGNNRWPAVPSPVVAVPTFVAAFWLFRLSSLPGLPVTVAVVGLGYGALRATGRGATGQSGWLLVRVSHAVLFGHALGTEDTGRFGRLLFLALFTFLIWAFIDDRIEFFGAENVDMDEWPGEDDDKW